MDILCCALCKTPLRVTCAVHGENFVPDRQPERAVPPDVRLRRASDAPTRRSKMIALCGIDPTDPTTAHDVARALDIPRSLASIELSALVTAGQLARVSPGCYIRHVAKP